MGDSIKAGDVGPGGVAGGGRVGAEIIAGGDVNVETGSLRDTLPGVAVRIEYVEEVIERLLSNGVSLKLGRLEDKLDEVIARLEAVEGRQMQHPAHCPFMTEQEQRSRAKERNAEHEFWARLAVAVIVAAAAIAFLAVLAVNNGWLMLAG